MTAFTETGTNASDDPLIPIPVAGADWVQESLKPGYMSSLGRDVADLLGFMFRGIYHIDRRDLDSVEWNNSHHVQISFRKSLDTWDFNELTILVILCHDAAIRCEITVRSPRRLTLMFHRRQRHGNISKRHPTIEAAIKSLRSSYIETRPPSTQ